MSNRVDFFEGVKNLHPPNRAWKRYDRNYSGTGSDNDYIPGMHIRGNTNENIPVHRTSPWTNHNNLPKDESLTPNSMSLEPRTTAADFSNKFPNEQVFSSTQQPPSPLPFAYNEVHPRTSAHLHQCHSCNCPVIVQVTADLYYHHVTFIPAAMAKTNNQKYDVNNFVNESQPLSHGRRGTQESSPVQEPEEEVSTVSNKPGEEEVSILSDKHGDDEEEVSILSNKPGDDDEEERTGMMITAPSEKTQQGFRTYASITAGNTIDSKADDNPLEETEETEETEDNAHLKAQVINDKAKENITASQVVDNGGDGDDDASDDGFTTVVSWKSKIKAKAAAKAKEAAAHGYGRGRGRNRLGKHGRGWPREEHNKNARMGPRDEQHDINDGGQRGGHDKRSRGGLVKDGHDKHGRKGPRNELDKHGTGDQKEDAQDKHVRGPWDERDKYGGFPRERNDKYGGYPREGNDKYGGFPKEQHTLQRETSQPKK